MNFPDCISVSRKSPEKRNREICRLRVEEQFTYREIADRFGLSVEGVRKIVRKHSTCDYPRVVSRFAKTLNNPGWLSRNVKKTNGQIAEEIGASVKSVTKKRGKTRHAIEPRSIAGIGAEWEEWTSCRLAAENIPNKLMPCNHPFDIFALGCVRIDVKSAVREKSSPSHECISPTYRFNVRKGNKRSDTDFYILVVAKTKDAFVIPADRVPQKMESIVFCWPTTRPELARWQKYHNRFDLIIAFAKKDQE